MVPEPPLPASATFPKWQTAPAPVDNEATAMTAPPPCRRASVVVAPRYTVSYSVASRHHSLHLPVVYMQRPGPSSDSSASASSVAVSSSYAANPIAPPTGMLSHPVAAAFQAKMVPLPVKSVMPVDAPQPASCSAIGPTRGRAVSLQPHLVVKRRSASACGCHCGREDVGCHPLTRWLTVALSRSTTSLLLSLPILAKEQRLQGRARGWTGR